MKITKTTATKTAKTETLTNAATTQNATTQAATTSQTGQPHPRPLSLKGEGMQGERGEAQKLLANAPAKGPVVETPVEQRAGKTLGIHGLREASKKTVFASVDLGSSSGKMLVLEKTAAGWKTLVDLKIGCALGKDVANGADIPKDNQDRAIAALQKFVAVAKDHGVAVQDIPMITTAVVRNANNGADFVKRVAAEVGLSAKVLSGDDEADIGYRGALGTLLKTPGSYASLDLGGGSFQLAIGTDKGLQDGGSTQIGSNLILDTMINPRVGADGRIDAAVFAHVDAELDRLAPMPLDTGLLAGRTLVATGGVSKFLRIQLGKDVVTRSDIEALRTQLGSLSIADRSAFVQQNKTDEQKEALGIGTRDGATDYGKKLPASMSLLMHILDGIGVSEVRVSTTDARHALIFQNPDAT